MIKAGDVPGEPFKHFFLPLYNLKIKKTLISKNYLQHMDNEMHYWR